MYLESSLRRNRILVSHYPSRGGESVLRAQAAGVRRGSCGSRDGAGQAAIRDQLTLAIKS